MKNKKKLIVIICTIVLALAAGLITFLLLNNKDDSKKKTNEEIKCENITGGSYELVFNTNGGEKLGNMHVCIACPPNTYENLPKAKKDGMIFAGWYYDKDLKKEVSVVNSMDIKPVPKKDKDGCTTGYEDITLYAKWSKEEVITLKVNFNSNGGSKVNTITFKCNSDNVATIKNLPKSKRDGYKFIAWEDKHENAILDGSKIECDGDLSLKAKWEIIETKPVSNPEPTPTTNKEISYECENGWTLEGTNCKKTSTTDKVERTYSCNNDETLIGKMCVKIKTTSDSERMSNTITTCNKASIIAGHGGPHEYDGVLFPDGVTCFYKEEELNKEDCLEKGYKWNSSNNKCYRESKMNNTTKTCKNDNYYYVANPNDYEGIYGKNSGCYPKRTADQTCPSGYAPIPSHGGTSYCGKLEIKPATKVEK